MHTTARPPLAVDFDSLEVGGEFTSRGRTVTEADVVGFSALTGDWHPQHADAEWAAASRFGERIAHGMLVLSLAIGLVDLDPERVVALRGISKATFKAPVRFGDTIHTEGVVVSLKPLDDATGMVETRWRVLNQAGKAVAVFTLEMLWRRSGGES
jgi:3-hydroxybutyryl-CoA dehydratase